MKTTISVIKADIGSVAGHVVAHKALKDKCREVLSKAKEDGIIEDFYVTNCGDDVNLIMTHRRGEDDEEVHRTAWEAFKEATKVSKKMKLYGAGQDLLSDTFSGNVKGLGPGCAEMEFKERPSDPVVVFVVIKQSQEHLIYHSSEYLLIHLTQLV